MRRVAARARRRAGRATGSTSTQRPIDPRDYDVIVSLGSEFAAFDDSIPWLGRELELLRAAVRATTSRCSGSASAASCWRGRSVASRSAAGVRDRLAAGPDQRPRAGAGGAVVSVALRHVHGAAGSAADRRQPGRPAGVHDRAQPRRPVPPRGDARRSWTLWVAAYRHELDQEGVDPDGLLEETVRRADQSRAAAWRLFDAFLDRVAGIAEAARGR